GPLCALRFLGGGASCASLVEVVSKGRCERACSLAGAFSGTDCSLCWGYLSSPMVVFSRLPSRLDSRTHFGAYAEGSSRFPFPSTGLLMDASHHSSTTTLLQLGRSVCTVMMMRLHPGATGNRGNQGSRNRAVKLPFFARDLIRIGEMDMTARRSKESI